MGIVPVRGEQLLDDRLVRRRYFFLEEELGGIRHLVVALPQVNSSPVGQESW